MSPIWRLTPATRQFGLYFLASLAALTVDLAILLTLADFVHYLIAATVGFCAGTVVSYFLSTRLVFDRRRLGHRETIELGVFTLVGVAGLMVNNAAIFAAVEAAAAPLAAAKLFAAGLTFLFNYLLRKRLLF